MNCKKKFVEENFIEPNLLIAKLKEISQIPSVLMKNIQEVVLNQCKIMKNLYKIVRDYEGENATLSELEKTLLEYRDQYEIAKSIQSSIYPTSLPDNNLISIYPKLVSLCETSGDFYDVVELLPNRVYGVLVTDVSGHGVSAALVTHMVKLLFVKAIEKYIFPKDVLKYLNKKICKILNQRSFFTAYYTVIDFPNKQLIYSAAGHSYNFRYNSKTKEIQSLQTKGMGMVMGVCDSMEYGENKVEFNVGDRIITYTDGLVEARNSEKEMFGEKRLHEAIKRHIEAPADILVKNIQQEIKTFMGKNNYDDDVTIVVIDIKGDKLEDYAKRNEEFTSIELQKVVSYYKKSIKLKENKNDTIGAIRDLINLGKALSRKGEYKKSLIYLFRAMKLSKDINLKKSLIEATLAIGHSYMRMGMPTEALDSAHKVIEYNKEIGDDKEAISEVYVLLAIIYARLGEPKRERNYLFDALKIVLEKKEPNKYLQAKIYNSIGVSYSNESKQEEALYYYQKSLNIAEKNNIIGMQVLLINNIGDIYRQQGKYDESLKYFHNGLLILKEVDNKELKGVILLNISLIYFKQNDYLLSMYYLKKANKIAKKYNLSYIESLVKGIRAYVYVKMNKIIKCLYCIVECIRINKNLQYDPLQGLIYTTFGIVLSKNYSDFPKKRLKQINKEITYILPKLGNKNTTPEWFFETGIEKSKTPLNSDTHIPALYEYGMYLFNKGEEEEAIEKFRESFKIMNFAYNYGEGKVIKNIIQKLNIKLDIFSE